MQSLKCCPEREQHDRELVASITGVPWKPSNGARAAPAEGALDALPPAFVVGAVPIVGPPKG